MIRAILRPRTDVLTGKIQGVIDLERFRTPKGKSLESEADAFLAATFPTGEIRKLIETLQRKLNHQGEESGLFLAEGTKGLGKSHVLLLILHLLQGSEVSRKWLADKGLKLDLPPELRIVWRKFTDFPLDSLWGVIGGELGAKFANGNARPPSLTEFQDAVGSQTLVLVFDELESGIRGIADEALRQQNVNFLQMLSEYANRAGSNVVLIGSIYDGNREPGLTLKRVPRVEIRFSDPTERRRVLFHRLFEVSPSNPNPDIDATVASFLNTWRRFGVDLPPNYGELLRETYPFSPELLDAVLVRMPQLRGGFQGTRGTLGFLASLIRQNPDDNLVSMADADLGDPELRSWLSDLDPSQNLIQCAESNLRELQSQSMARPIASAVLFGSLVPSTRQPGLTISELARQVVEPATDYNVFGQTVNAFERYASYFHRREGGFLFDTKENAYSKVELGSLSVDATTEAWPRLVDWWRVEVLRDGNAIILDDVDVTRARLESVSHDDTTLVVSPRRLANDERHRLYFGLKARNAVLLIEPKDDKLNLKASPDLLKYGQKFIAAESLAGHASEDPARASEFNRIGGEDKKSALLYLRKISLAYVQVTDYGQTAKDSSFMLENVPVGGSADEIRTHLNKTLYPPSLVREHLQDRASDLLGMKVAQVEAQYRNTLGFPVLVFRTTFQEALESLVESGTVISIEPPGHPGICGARPHLRGEDFRAAVIAKPFESPPSDPGRRPGAVSRPPLSATTSGQQEDSCDDTDVVPFRPPATEQLSTPFCSARDPLRQAVARLLDERGAPTVAALRIDLTFDSRHCDMSVLPSFIRGTLTGAAEFHGESSLTFAGPLTKAAVEAMMERLPDFAPGSCRVMMTLQV
ncbi:MAG: hypothetical protein NTV46_02935 [Verrucomicrobia bacterium]|nr:hypothetical protein [Verrucomicrobiota bacterium]